MGFPVGVWHFQRLFHCLLTEGRSLLLSSGTLLLCISSMLSQYCKGRQWAVSHLPITCHVTHDHLLPPCAMGGLTTPVALWHPWILQPHWMPSSSLVAQLPLLAREGAAPLPLLGQQGYCACHFDWQLLCVVVARGPDSHSLATTAPWGPLGMSVAARTQQGAQAPSPALQGPLTCSREQDIHL